MREMIRINVGSDVKAFPVFPINESQLIKNISNIDEVNLTATIRGYPYITVIEEEYTDLLIIDENYFNVFCIMDEYLEGATVEEVFSKFRDGENYCIISKYLGKNTCTMLEMKYIYHSMWAKMK